MRDLSDSGLYFLSTQRAGLQLQGTLHAQVTEGEEKPVKACFLHYEKLINNNKTTQALCSLVSLPEALSSPVPQCEDYQVLWIHLQGLRGAPAAQHLPDLQLLMIPLPCAH